MQTTRSPINFKNFFISLALAVVWVAGFFVWQNKYLLPAVAQDEEEDNTPPLIYNVGVSGINATSSIISWETDELADSLINYGLSKEYGIIRDPRADKQEHMIIVENLMSDTLYYFRITSADGSGNQGISSDYTFQTIKDKDDLDYLGFQEDVSEEGIAGLNEIGVEEILQVIKSISSEEVLEEIEEELRETAEEVISPPTIILDYADVEVGTDYAIITWDTDKESNTIVALADEDDYDEEAADPYRWREGSPNDLSLEHWVEITGLTPATVYHFQVSSESVLGLTGYSSDKTFKTKSILPEIYNIQLFKVEEESATIRYSTNVPCSSIIEYTNLNTNDTKLEGNSSYLTVHLMQLNNLIFDTYYSFIIRVESENEEKAESNPITFITIKDEEPPIISKVNTESTLYPGTENRIQTVASWQTDEPAQCQLFYHQGLIVIDEPQSLLREEDYGVKHVQVITNFLPSTVYKFWIICNDEADNSAKSEDFTMLTPTQEESIIDIIIRNFESTFGWLKKIKI
ncbi:fibronectin type III domain-containing protein [Candidatus Parcubacteria bacterium]|nr:fibronectin type III domain-containing protein [Candidatus Parcubacteria bacterium]